MPLSLFALTVGAFGIGVTEFVIMGLLLEVGADLGVTTGVAGLLISGYALGVVVGAPLVTIATARWPRKMVLLSLMGVFIAGNIACALASTYGLLMAARVLTAFAHGAFFGVGSVVATRLVGPGRQASAIATMFTGLTIANVAGVPLGVWIGQHLGWRATFWAVAVIGLAAAAAIAAFVPGSGAPEPVAGWRGQLKALVRRPVLLGLFMTTLGYAGVFAVFTFLAPLLTTLSGFRPSAISPILLLFGVGLIVGNLLGGRLADRNLARAVIATLATLAAVLAATGFALHSQPTALLAVFGLGASAFATVAPLQAWVLQKAEGVGESLASSFNIAAFNLGNALGAWVGSVVIDHGPGLAWIPGLAALFPLCGLIVATFVVRHRNPIITQTEHAR